MTPRNTVKEIKHQLEHVERIPVMQQRLTFQGAELQDMQTLAQYGVKNGDRLELNCWQ